MTAADEARPDVDAIRERHADITPGKWWSEPTTDPIAPAVWSAVRGDDYPTELPIPFTEDDAEFIAHAPADVADLLAAHDALRQQLDAVTAERDRLLTKNMARLIVLVAGEPNERNHLLSNPSSLTPEQTVRLLRAKANELEYQVKQGRTRLDPEVWQLKADLALLCDLFATHIIQSHPELKP